MASLIIGSAIAIGIAVKDRKDKKREKARLAEEQYSEMHGKPTVVSPRQQRKQEKVVVSDLPSYESTRQQRNQEKLVGSDLPSYETVISGRQDGSNVRFGDEKQRRNSEESLRRE
ncbi:hypothetical protein H2200_000386 [Cladophialophora chaetospira]|uniref:Uncharacterized protein n=1 Tax=Cladophialophora chaetospira TaxID=386627 RepID=A0AA38XNG4_9EURO|nr:hypothetical protein H2200_000386 [Cladophialophora chaetospira]